MSATGVVFVIWLGCVAAGFLVHHSPHQRRKRRQRALEQARRQEAIERSLARQWLEAVAYHQRDATGYGYTRTGLAHVSEVYGAYPRRGTKAILTWYGGGQDDAWFELAWPRAGQWLLVSGRFGYGEHNQNPHTYYCYIVGVVPPGAFEAWRRQTADGQLPPAPAQLD